MHNVVSSMSAAAIVILLMASPGGCEPFSNQNDDCEATKMATTVGTCDLLACKSSYF